MTSPDDAFCFFAQQFNDAKFLYTTLLSANILCAARVDVFALVCAWLLVCVSSHTDPHCNARRLSERLSDEAKLKLAYKTTLGAVIGKCQRVILCFYFDAPSDLLDDSLTDTDGALCPSVLHLSQRLGLSERRTLVATSARVCFVPLRST